MPQTNMIQPQVSRLLYSNALLGSEFLWSSALSPFTTSRTPTMINMIPAKPIHPDPRFSRVSIEDDM
jgi:hypothetical protein